MAPQLARNVAGMPRSGIRVFMDLAWSLEDVIHLEVGEPDFSTPAHIVAAADEAARAGKTRYTPNPGTPELRAALADKIAERNGIPAEAERVVVTNGAVQGLYSSLLATLDAGDEVLLPDPGWPNFRMMAALVGATAVGYPLHAEAGYEPRAEDIEPLVTDRTRVLMINTPSNPLGTVIAPHRLADLVELARDHDLWVVADECYDEITFSGAGTSPGTFDTDERVISVYSFSKTYAMTGWRVGYVLLPERLAASVATLQEPLISCVSAPSQAAALRAVTGPQECVAEMVHAYRDRRDAAVQRLGDAGIGVVPPNGAFYLWVDVSGSGLSSADFAHRAITEARVATVPGPAFGPQGEGAVRLSLAASKDLLLEGIDRLSDLHAAVSA